MKQYIFEAKPWEADILREQFPDATFIDEPLTEDNAGNFGDATIVSVFVNSRVTRAALEALPGLQCIATRSTGFDHIDTGYAKERGIVVCNVPEYGSRTVAEFTFGLLLTLTRKIFSGIRQSKECIFDTSTLQGTDLFGKTIGVIGMGRIGSEVIKLAHGFGMNVLVYTAHPRPEQAEELNFRFMSLEDLLAHSDVVTLHLPLTPETTHILNKDTMAKIKKGAYLINTARGPLIDTEALLVALEDGTLAGAGLDVLEEEKEINDELELLTSHDKHNVDFKTMCIDHALMHHPRVVVTPHNAFNTKEALERILHTTIDNIKKFLEGQAQNRV
ncbi:MAG: NAD(P)-binding domain-containing protein [Patescibacteria group bacterium]|nr:NAD(P)-binding domain-containing protein [Patescibacteria group bacterium]